MPAASQSQVMLKKYTQDPEIKTEMFLTSFFTTKPEDITDAEYISYDIERSEEDIAPVLTDISTGANVVSADVFTNKQIKPPAYAVQMPFNVYDLINRMAGYDEYSDARLGYEQKLAMKIIKAWKKLTNIMKRTIEYQASQILQTGTVTLYDENGIARYDLDYAPKASHFPSASIAWGVAGYNPITDINSLSQEIKKDSFVRVENLIMGDEAFFQFIAHSEVEKLFDKEGLAVAALNPTLYESGATLQGFVTIGSYRYNVWTYDGTFRNPATGLVENYLNPDSVIFLPNKSKLDFRKCFGAIPSIDIPFPLQQFAPANITIDRSMMMKPRFYIDQKSETFFAEMKARPLLIPVSIDAYGCLDTNATT